MNLDDRADQLMAMPKYELARFAASLEGFCDVTPEEKAAAFEPEVVTSVSVDVGGSPVEVMVSHDKADEAPIPEAPIAPKADPVVAQIATDQVLAAPAPATEMLDAIPEPVVESAPVQEAETSVEVAPVEAVEAAPVEPVAVPAAEPLVEDAPLDLRALSKAPGK